MVINYVLKVTGRPDEPEFAWMHGGPADHEPVLAPAGESPAPDKLREQQNEKNSQDRSLFRPGRGPGKDLWPPGRAQREPGCGNRGSGAS
jgi:hypothetical protein